jgi:hypothetical protein
MPSAIFSPLAIGKKFFPRAISRLLPAPGFPAIRPEYQGPTGKQQALGHLWKEDSRR